MRGESVWEKSGSSGKSDVWTGCQAPAPAPAPSACVCLWMSHFPSLAAPQSVNKAFRQELGFLLSLIVLLSEKPCVNFSQKEKQDQIQSMTFIIDLWAFSIGK